MVKHPSSLSLAFIHFLSALTNWEVQPRLPRSNGWMTGSFQTGCEIQTSLLSNLALFQRFYALLGANWGGICKEAKSPPFTLLDTERISRIVKLPDLCRKECKCSKYIKSILINPLLCVLVLIVTTTTIIIIIIVIILLFKDIKCFTQFEVKPCCPEAVLSIFNESLSMHFSKDSLDIIIPNCWHHDWVLCGRFSAF